MEIHTVTVKPEKARAIKSNKHPWIFDGALVNAPASLPDDTLVEVEGKGTGTIGWGIYCSPSKIRIRMVSFDKQPPAASWLSERIGTAFDLRKTLAVQSNAYRLVNGEGDFIPGLTIDVYHETIVVRPLVRYIECKMNEIVEILSELFPKNTVYLKRDEHAARAEHLELKTGYVKGEGTGEEMIEEHGMRFFVDIERGQKTGFYLDQRENRNIVSRIARGKSVCNLFSYTGAFSVAAVKGGAERVLSIDSSQGAIDCAQRNAELNDPGSNKYAWECVDVFSIMDRIGTHDIMIVDPPPFARKKAELEGALSGYRFLNESAIRACGKNGMMLTFSCSHAVGRDTFYDVIFESAKRSGRNVRIVQELVADVDHPVSMFHPEGNYLKGLLLHVE